jgi:putative membrane protein
MFVLTMIRYNPKDWFTFIFRFHKADTFRTLAPLILLISLYSGCIAWLELDYFHIDKESHIRNVSIIHSTLGLVISLLLVFRTNTAYERWWEGRKMWGSLVNSSRNLSFKLSILLPNETVFFNTMISNYAFALKNHLRDQLILSDFEECQGFNRSDLQKDKHIPNQIYRILLNRILEHEKNGVLKPEHVLLINTEMINFSDVLGACERIRKTPIPFSYSVFLKKFTFLYVMTFPIGFVFSLGYLVMPVVGIIFYVLASLELIAEEIEDPFGNDANDLPTDEISRVIRNTIE